MDTNDLSLEKIISSAIQVPGVKVNRTEFLKKAFSKFEIELPSIIEDGPVKAGISREELAKIAHRLILDRTSKSSIISFAAGIPGGFAAAASIPADVIQFFGMNLRLAQELSYLYGAQDLWLDGEVDDEKVLNQLILYCGVMFGAAGAGAGVRLLAGRLAMVAAKRIPQIALMKTFWYPLLKQICRFIGVTMTKKTLASGVAKALPVIGGVVSGSLNFATMMPMANKLQKTLDIACFEYTEEDMDADIIELSNIDEVEDKAAEEFEEKKNTIKEKFSKGAKNISEIISKRAKSTAKEDIEEDIFDKLEKLAKLRDSGIITQEEFDEKKADLLSRI